MYKLSDISGIAEKCFCIKERCHRGRDTTILDKEPDLHPILSLNSMKDLFLKITYKYGIDVEIPLTYYFNCECVSGIVSLVPYLDWNNYGRPLLANQLPRDLKRILTGVQLIAGVEF